MKIDKKKLDEISRWFNKSKLGSATIEYSSKGDFKITLKKEVEHPVYHAKHPDLTAIQRPVEPLPAEPKPSTQAQEEAEQKVMKQEGTEFISSPIVGTFYRAAGPDSPPFAQVGDKIKKGEVLCILEAMKVMNEFEAEFDMEILSVFVENSQMVEYGQKLFEVKPL